MDAIIKNINVVKSGGWCHSFPQIAKGGVKLTGIYRHTIDAKGRLFIPSRLREELGDNFYITISMEKCLSAFSNESWLASKEKFNMMSRESKKRMRSIYAHASPGVLDSQGRVLIPQALRKWANLDKNVTVVGAGDCVEFWDSEAWEIVDEIETTPEYIAEVFKELDF